MPYIFGLTLILNIAALGYFMFAHKSLTGDSPTVVQAKSEISKTIPMSKGSN